MNNLAVKETPIRKRDYSNLTLLLSNHSNEKLVRQIFSDEYTINTTKNSFEAGQFDVLITDERSFLKCADTYEKIKNQARPIVLPVLLLMQGDSRSFHKSKFAEIVDDILLMPTSPNILRARIKQLLQTRHYSKQLEEERRKYQLLAENSTDMISTHNPDGIYEYVSPSSKFVFGYKPEELIGRNAFDFIHEDDHGAVEECREFTIRTKKPTKVEFRKRAKSGEFRWVESIIKTMDLYSDSEGIYIQAATRDISDRKKYEQKLQKEVSFSHAALDAIPNIFFMADSELKFVRWNKNLEENLGYSKHEIERMTPFDFFGVKDHGKVKAKIREVLVDGEAELEADLVTKTGELIRHRISGREFFEDEKKFIIGACVDISKDFEVMNQLKASNREKQVLLLEIHHRVKNNLAVISSMLQLQAMESDDPVLGDMLNDSQMRVQTIASIHELLYQSESFTHLDMEKYLRNLVDKIKETNILNKDILIDEDISTVNLNINQAIPCSLIANELITNAFKHAFKNLNSGTVHVTLTEVNDSEVQLVVEDNGEGMPEDIDFDRPRSLGLQLIDVLRQQLKGTLDITKPHGHGTRFCLTFKKEDVKGSANGHLKNYGVDC